ncbi:hypothetical protein KR018_007838, partial [Drosophila ironensis]
QPRLHIETSTFVVPQLAGELPSRPVPPEVVESLPDIQPDMADPSFHQGAPIDILIGADLYPSILLEGSRRHICCSLLGQETVFGWVLSGPVRET